MNKLELKTVTIEKKHSRHLRTLIDYFIDDIHLYESIDIGDFISPFGWLSPEGENHFANNFLLKNTPQLKISRYPIFVCSECADLGCGAVTARLEKNKNSIEWSQFGVQNDYDDNIDYSGLEKIGPFHFDWESYKAIFEGIIRVNSLPSKRLPGKTPKRFR